MNQEMKQEFNKIIELINTLHLETKNEFKAVRSEFKQDLKDESAKLSKEISLNRSQIESIKSDTELLKKNQHTLICQNKRIRKNQEIFRIKILKNEKDIKILKVANHD